MLPEQKEKYHKALRIGLIVFVAVIIANIISGNFSHNGNYNDNKPVNTISLSGHGEVTSTPNIANINFTVRQEGKTVKIAEDALAPIVNKSLDLLKTNKITDADVTAQSVSFNPKYSYQYSSDVICGALTCPPRPEQQVISGYEAYETISVKIRNVDSVGMIVAGLGALGVTELSGPNFTIDKPDDLKAAAQKKAIDDARAKAKVLAGDLGVRLGKVTSFSDNGNNYPMPMYDKAMTVGAAPTASPAPAIVPTGTNTISSDVTITYEIK